MIADFTCSFRKRDAYDRMIELHSHEGLCELYFLSSGERRYFIQDTVVPVHAKGFVFIKAGLLHKTSYLGGGQHSRYYANVPSRWFEDMLDSLPPFFVVEKVEDLEMLFSHLLREAEGDDVFSLARCRSLCVEILVRAYREYMSKTRMGDEFLEEVTRYVKAHLAQRICLEDVARHMSLSPNYFSALFHRKSGMRLGDFIRAMRISVAADALDAGRSVGEAALLAGFPDPGYFKDVFRKEMKISPSAYRKGRSAVRR